MNRFILSLSAALMALHLAACGAEQPADTGLTFNQQRLARMDDVAKSFVDGKMLPGMSYLISKGGTEIRYGNYGARDMASNSPIKRDTIFRIYSMTKPITGIAMMMLYEEGRFLLDDPVEKYIPEFKDMPVFAGVAEDGSFITEPQARKMTMADLMSHTAGFTYGLFSNTPVDQKLRAALKPGLTNADMIKILADLPLLFQPGSRWHYSLSVDIQGYLVEKLSGMPLDAFFEKRIFTPLGMTDTGFYVPAEKADRLITLYTYNKQGQLVSVPNDSPMRLTTDDTKKPSWLSGGGGLFATIDDYMKFANMVSAGGKGLVSPTSIDLMRRNHVSNAALKAGGLAAKGQGFGLNFAVITDATKSGTVAYEGSYNWGGAASTIFWIDPTHDLVVIGMTSVLGGPSDLLRKHMRAATYQALVK